MFNYSVKDDTVGNCYHPVEWPQIPTNEERNLAFLYPAIWEDFSTISLSSKGSVFRLVVSYVTYFCILFLYQFTIENLIFSFCFSQYLATFCYSILNRSSFSSNVSLTQIKTF